VGTQVVERTFFDWCGEIIAKYWPMMLSGAGVTLLLAITGTVIGFLIGLMVGTIKTIPMPSKKGFRYYFQKVVNILLSVYVEVFRGTPMIVQAMVIYYGLAMAFNIKINTIVAGILIVSINTGAYMAEIVRGGIESIDKGQFDAAHAVGMSHWKTMLHVILPQTVRNILPATGNEFVINIKDTSVLNVISVTELYFQGKSIAGANFRYFESFLVICVIYLILTFSITRILRFIEKKMDGPANYEVQSSGASFENVVVEVMKGAKKK